MLQKLLLINSMYSKKIPLEIIAIIKDFSFSNSKQVHKNKINKVNQEVLNSFSSNGEYDEGDYSYYIFMTNYIEYTSQICNTCGNFAYYELVFREELLERMPECIICNCTE